MGGWGKGGGRGRKGKVTSLLSFFCPLLQLVVVEFRDRHFNLQLNADHATGEMIVSQHLNTAEKLQTLKDWIAIHSMTTTSIFFFCASRL